MNITDTSTAQGIVEMFPQFPDDFQALLREAIDSAGMNAVEAQLKALLRSAETRPKTGPKEAEKEAAPA